MEMESYMLLHLAHCAKKPTYATAAAIVVANRKSADVIDNDTIERLEDEGGKAILEALYEYNL
jgi:uridine phosphorylase